MSGEDRRICEEAAGWVARARAGLSVAEKAQFGTWLRERPEHAAAADLAMRAWEAAPTALGGARPAIRAQARRRARAWRPAVAAALGVAVLVGASLGWQAGVSRADLATGQGERRMVAMADGSRLWLAPRSAAHVEITPLGRQVVLDHGEAAFDVAHQWRPFRVIAQNIEVVDKGTLFGVRSRAPGDVRVVLLRGAVELRDAQSGARLASPRSGEQARTSGGGVEISALDSAGALDWRKGRLVFQQMPLGEALARFAEQGAPPVRLADPRLASLPVSGAYNIADMESFLDGLTAILPLRVVRGRQGYVIESR